MNIFYVSKDVEYCARCLDDKRLNKMITETAQILSSAIYKISPDKYQEYSGLYKPTHLSHPSVIWASEQESNWCWLFYLYDAYLKEYEFRRGKPHANIRNVLVLYKNSELNTNYEMVDKMHSEPPKLVIDKDRNIDFSNWGNIFDGYKLYLLAKWETDKIAPKWTKRTRPEWR